MAESNERTFGGILRALSAADQLDEADRARIVRELPHMMDRNRTPWFLQPLVFLGALVAAVLLSLGITATLDLRWQTDQLWIMGAIYLIVAVVLHRVESTMFVHFLALAFSIGGHGFVLVGVASAVGHRHFEIAMLGIAAGLCVVLYGLYRDFLHRFLSCLSVFVIARFALPREGLGDALHALFLGAVIVCGVLLTRARQRPVWRPLAYACAWRAVVSVLPSDGHEWWFKDYVLPHRWISSVTAGLALLAVSAWACRRAGERVPTAQVVVAVLVIAGLTALGAPGIPAALFLVVLGHATHHWHLTLVALASLPIFVWHYYYDLELDFVAKSSVLVGSGALLLVARAALGSLSRAEVPA